MNRWLLAEQLACWSSDITVACDGREAWQYLQAKTYTLVLLDINMPGMTGHELVKNARADSLNKSSRIVAITAHVQSQQRHLLIAGGFDECLIKPIVLADLQRVISGLSAPNATCNTQYYARVLMDKVEHNPDLGRLFLQKLMQEVPEQIAQLQQALQSQAIDVARHIAHKLHGSFAFYGFADFHEIAERLEYALLAGDLVGASRNLQALTLKFDGLLSQKTDVMAHFDTH